MNRYSIGLIGFAHVHVVDNTTPFLVMPERVEWIGGTDMPTQSPKDIFEAGMCASNIAWLEQRSVLPRVFDNHLQLLDQKPDIVIVSTENNLHEQVVTDALRRGIHVIVEKPLCIDLAGVRHIYQVAQQSNARLIVNWPSTWSSAVRTAQRLVEEGAIGKPFKFQFRNSASPGPLGYGQKLTDEQRGQEWWHHAWEGGGATLDYCCYGCNLARWFLGPGAMDAYGLNANFNSRYGDADDYGIIVARFPEAVAIIEGSWTTVNSGVAAGPIVFGLSGTLVADWSIHGGSVKLYKSYGAKEPDEEVKLDPMPIGRANLAEEVIHCLDTGDALHPTLDQQINMDTMMLLCAGMQSAKSLRIETLPTLAWNLGNR